MENTAAQTANLKLVRLYDNTRISSHKKCSRDFLYRHILDWVSARKKLPLIFGSSWHAAMDVIWAGYRTPEAQRNGLVDEAYAAFLAEWQKNGMPHPDDISPDELDDIAPRTPQIANEMLYNYLDARQHLFSDPSFKLLEIEKPFAVPLDPDDDSLFYVGRLDKIVEYRKQVIIIEHKSSTAYRKGGPFRAEFLDSFSPNSQVDGYLYALRMLYGERASACWVDAALVHRTVHDGFKFIPIDRQFAQLDAWLWETHVYIDQIEGNKAVLKERAALDTPYLAAFPKNTGSCGNFGGCEYLDICKMIANPAVLEEPPLGYKREHWSPFSEVKLEELGLTIEKTGERLREKAASE